MSGKRRAAEQYGQQMGGALQNQSDLVQQMFQERKGYSQQAEQLLGQYPTYTIPNQVKQYQQLMNNSGTELWANMLGYGNQLKNTDYTAAGQKSMQDAANTYNTSATSLRDIMRKGVQESSDYAKQGFNTGLQDTNSFVNFYRNIANRQEMPGQRATESKIGRSYAELYKSLGQQGGGSATSLGAMIDASANKAESLADLGIQAAQYKASSEANYGEALQRAQAVRAELFSQMSSGAMSRAGALASTEQIAGTMQATGQENLANYALNRQSAAQNSIMAQADLANQGITGRANMQGSALMTGAEYADQAYQFNQLMPYQNQLNYYMSQISSLNPYAAQSDVYNQQMNAIGNLYQLFGKRGRHANFNF